MTTPAPAILFVGAVVDDASCTRSPACNPAGNSFQRELLAILRDDFGVTPSVLTLEPVATFPRSRRLWSRRRPVAIAPGLEGSAVACVNLPLLKQLSIAVSVRRQVRAWLRRTEGTPRRLLLSCNLYPPFALPLLAVARHRAVTTVALVCDFPHNQSHDVAGWRGLSQRLVLALERRAAARFAGLVAVTPAIGEDFAPATPLLVFEGGARDHADAAATVADPRWRDERILVFAGTLNEINGVELTLEGFARLEDPAARLWVFGRGPLAERVRAAAAADPRIRFWGFLPQAEVRALLAHATLLLNLRLSRPLTRYTFPSKLLEYMASGRAVVSTSFTGIPEDYRRRLLVLEEETPAGLAHLLSQALARPTSELELLGAEARRFVLEERSWQRQGARLGEFVRGLWGERPSPTTHCT